MCVLLPLALCALVASCQAVSPPQQSLGPLPLLSRACNDVDVLGVAGLALQDINRDRKDGYVLSLNRVNDVREHRQAKAWKDCGERHFHESVYGQCKAVFYINRPRRVLYLPAYNCTLRPVARRRIQFTCPDCPGPINPSYPQVLEAATQSLAKYNNESTSKQYSLVKVTRASSQWVFGPSYFVEYLIKESPCAKSQDSSCSLQPSDSEPVGLCTGSLSRRHLEKWVSVSCNFFEAQAPAPGGEKSAVNQGPESLPKVEEPQKKDLDPTPSPSKAVPRGSVQYLPDLNKSEDLDEVTPEDFEGKNPHEALPVQLDLTTNPQGETLDVSSLFLGPTEKLVVLPFPKGLRSAECPGPAQKDNPLVLPP
ncbi:Fetuin-B [Tupaia chinensis]|uniref:Fetuin-B n=1 Tax=Tupaia chinensis TaxID=246437 RepID=L8Y341_TUPCH|nr:Fetuin-B [Tupaia chinensis]